MTPLHNNKGIRAIEAQAFAIEPSFTWMARAGAAVARQAAIIIENNQRPLLVLAGPGNNGGDALVAARLLRKAGKEVRVTFLGETKKLSTDAKKALDQWNGGFTDFVDDDYALIIDGLFGVGISRPLTGVYKDAVQRINRLCCPVLSIDMPSGINSDTGAVMGEAVHATGTVTFFAAKPGLYTGCGIQAAGKVIIETLNFQNTVPSCGIALDEDGDLAWHCLQRYKNTHKGDYGALAVVGGATGMTGALALATRAAVRLGAGKVFALSLADNTPLLDWLAPEIMWYAATKEILANLPLKAIAIGVGLGVSPEAKKLLKTVVTSHLPLVVDADALNLLAQYRSLRIAVVSRQAFSILTPHPAEAARLLRCDTMTVNQDRIGAAQQLAREYNACVVLKGAGTIIADKNSWCICSAGNPGLAQAGAGDVLTGFIGALLVQTQDAAFAAQASVWLHAAAADTQATQSGEIGLNLNALGTTAACRLNQCVEKTIKRRWF